MNRLNRYNLKSSALIINWKCVFPIITNNSRFYRVTYLDRNSRFYRVTYLDRNNNAIRNCICNILCLEEKT